MYNPTYLIRSRHNVFYFRWPLPQALQSAGKNNRITVSLQTRDPSEALRLANMLEYHASIITEQVGFAFMEHAEIVLMLKDHFYALLDEQRARIRRDGPLPKEAVAELKNELERAEEAIGNDRDVVSDKELDAVLKSADAKMGKGSKDYKVLKQEYKHALRGYCEKLLAHNDSVRAYTFSTRPEYIEARRGQSKTAKAENRLGNVINAYLAEMQKAETWEIRTREERQAAYGLLTELLSDRFNMPDVDAAKARMVKETLMQLPVNRSKLKATRDLSIFDQIKVEGVPKLSVGSVNKYLACYSGLFKWAKRNGFVESNPFEGMAVKNEKAKKKRDAFSLAQIQKIIAGLQEEDDYRYWGILIALYTGARLNEIASLTANDIKKEQGIWYFDINEEEEKKRVKTDAGKRIVPVHTELLKRGFMNYVAKVKAMDGKELRLLHKLTYRPKEGWGRNLGRWFNEDYLVKHGLKSKTLTFHSLRHTAITTMRQAGVDNHIVRALVGHEADGVTEQVYNKGYKLAQLKEAIDVISY